MTKVTCPWMAGHRTRIFKYAHPNQTKLPPRQQSPPPSSSPWADGWTSSLSQRQTTEF
jgi:hypothetical protein